MDAEYGNTLIQTDAYRLAEHGGGIWRAWKMIWVGLGVFMNVEKFSNQNLPKCLTSGQPLLSVLEAA